MAQQQQQQQQQKLPYNQDAHYVAAAAAAAAHEPAPPLDEAIRRTQSLLLSHQFPDGYWCGEVESNISMIAESLIFYKILSVDHRYPLHKIEAYIRQQLRRHPQPPSSAYWELAYGDRGNLSITIEAYVALRLLGVPISDPDLADPLRFILSRGGASASRVFTKICLALLGCFDWHSLPSLPPWFVLLPASYLTSIYEMASWARASVVPLTILFDKKPIFRVRVGSSATATHINLDELFVEGSFRDAVNLMPSLSRELGWRGNMFVVVDYMLKTLERLGWVPFRQRGLLAAEKWVLEHQEDTGEWSFLPPTFYSILALHTLGYPVTDPVIERGLDAIASFSVEMPDVYHAQACTSPVWDTAHTIRSLVESGVPPDHPALRHAATWLLKKQILQPGDWFFKNPTNRTGAWAFEFFNRWYPDVDDSAVVVMALDLVCLPPAQEPAKRSAMGRAIAWIASMQCKAGGWGAFDKDNDQDWLNAMPFGDLKAMIDPNTADVTARVVEMVGQLRLSSKENLALLPPREVLERGIEYLRREQEREGCWFGRWGVNYIYGTSGAVAALALSAGKESYEEEVGRAAKWLVDVQNGKDGGWGESILTYHEHGVGGARRGTMDGDEADGSTAAQTAWAILGLLSAGEALGRYEMEAIERGVMFLLTTQRADGSWHDRSFTGTGFPGHFYMRYHLYAQYFPLTALGRYRAACSLHRPML